MVEKEWRIFSQWFWKGFFKWYDGGGENGITLKRIFEVEASFSSQNVNFPFIWIDFWSLSFLFLFRSLIFFSSVSWGLRGFNDILGENHFFKNLFSNGFNILAVDTYFGVELSMPTRLNHDYGDGGVTDILVLDAYSEVDVCTPIYMGEASN
jgi:hypothetical protein